MDESLKTKLNAVSRRQWNRVFLRRVFAGLLVGELFAVLGLALIPLGWAGNFSVWSITLSALSAGTITGMIFGFTAHASWSNAAYEIDSRYHLKDRIATALFLDRSGRSDPIARLQKADAVAAAVCVHPNEVCPFRRPDFFYRTMALAVLLLVLCMTIPLFDSQQKAVAVEPMPELVELTETIRKEVLETVTELAKEVPEESAVQELQKKWEKLTSELQNETSDPKETLATLSEMEEAVRQTIAQFDLEAEAEVFAEIGEAFTQAKALTTAGKAMSQGNWSEAVKELHQSKSDQLSEPERKKTAEKLKSVAKKQNNHGPNTQTELTNKLADTLANGTSKDCDSLLLQLAQTIKRHSLRKGMCKSLSSKLMLVGLCKSNCAGACAGSKNGGLSTNISEKGNQLRGKGSSGNPLSRQDSKLDSTRTQSQLTGMRGDGPSEIETVTSDQVTGEATRPYTEVYREYQKMSESVLESEPIPLGNRQVIRRYFESIRPSE